MGYKSEYFNTVIQSIEKKYGAPAPRWLQAPWRVQIAKLFDDGILISEIIAALDEAMDAKKWPMNTGLMKRVKDIVYLHRKEEKKTVKVDSGMQSLKDLLKK